jgi:transcriptional regulator with XRE-family HTH domain
MRGSPPRSKAAHKSNEARAAEVSRLRELREDRGFTRERLAELAGMHRNSIYLLEKGISKSISHEHSTALAAALGVRPVDLGVPIRPAEVGVPRSVGFRRLPPDKRKLIDELMSLSPREYEVVSAALEKLLAKKHGKRRHRK